MFSLFLVATKRLYLSVCPSVGWLVRWLVGPLVGWSVGPSVRNAFAKIDEKWPLMD